jgi:hypothetical protein
MPQLTSILIGALAAVGAWALVVPAETATKVPGAGAGDLHWQVDLARKGDRLSVAGRSDDRDGRILVQSDAVTNVSIVAKSVTPALPVRETMHTTPARREVPTRLQAPAIPVGCDPVVSAVAEPGLARHLEHVTGHCVS